MKLKTIWVAKVETEDGEGYYLAFNEQPSENKVKELFFENYGYNYEEEDWGVCISHDVFELNIM